jgi:3-oxoisoapionate decarboxylase
MELGISSWSLPWSIGVPGHPRPPRPLDALGLLEKSAALKVSVVQIADNLPLHKLPESELDRIREKAVALGLSVEAGTRGLDPQNLVQYVMIAHRIGARLLRTVLSGSLLDIEELANAEQGIRQVLPTLQRLGVTLAFENNEAFSASEFAGLMRRINSPYVGICLDSANSLGRPETLDEIVKHLAEYAVMFHAKDYNIRRIDTRMGFCILGKPVGSGRVDFDWVLAELRRRGRDQLSVIVEHWPPFEGSIEATIRLEEEWLTKSVEFLRARLSPYQQNNHLAPKGKGAEH